MRVRLVGWRAAVLIALLAAACGGPTSHPGMPPPSATLPAASPIGAPPGAPATADRATAAGRGSTAPSTGATRRGVPSASVAGLPSGCERDEIARRLELFFAAFNAGDQARLGTFFGPRFQWYSVSEGQPGAPGFRDFTTDDRAALPAYFAQRHAHDERLRLRSLYVGPSGVAGIANIVYEFTRAAADLAPGPGGAERRGTGKGGIDCADQTIVAWSMGLDPAQP